MHPLLTRFFSFFIANKNKRKQYRREQALKYEKQKLKKYRFGVSYSLFDGIELLEPSIKSIRSEVDYVNVVYQMHSWYGEPVGEDLPHSLSELKRKGLIDEVIEYMPEISKPAGLQELNKRNLGLRYAKKAKVDYFMTMDVDEFYCAKNVAEAKKVIVEKNITRSFVTQVLYGRKPTKLNLNFGEACYVPFFCKINMFSKLGRNSKVPCRVDKTRRFAYSMFDKCFVLDGVVMHHLSEVRKDYAKKKRNSSTQQTRKKRRCFILHKGKAEVRDVFGVMEYL